MDIKLRQLSKINRFEETILRPFNSVNMSIVRVKKLMPIGLNCALFSNYSICVHNGVEIFIPQFKQMFRFFMIYMKELFIFLNMFWC